MNARLENPMVSGLARHLDRLERADAVGALAYATLRDEVIDALMSDPAKAVRTPGFARAQQMPAAEVVADAMAGTNGDAMLHELLSIVGACAKGQADHNLHLRASAWIAARAAEHAQWHVDDFVEQIRGNA